MTQGDLQQSAFAEICVTRPFAITGCDVTLASRLHVVDDDDGELLAFDPHLERLPDYFIEHDDAIPGDVPICAPP